MATTRESDKALRYITQLDEARCAGRWQEVPELCARSRNMRPTDPVRSSHLCEARRCLPQFIGLTLTARSEAQIFAYSSQRPPTAASTKSTSSLSKIIPTLLTAIDQEGDHVQDAFQATVCLGWLHYVLEEPGLAIARLPADFTAVTSKLSQSGAPPTGWSRVCVVKGAFLKGMCVSQDRTGSTEDAVHSYNSIIPWLSSLDNLQSESPLFKSWTERLLIQLCKYSDQSSARGEFVDPADALRTYRFWAKFWESAGKSTTADNMAQHRRAAWKAYYNTLSTLLQERSMHGSDTSLFGNGIEQAGTGQSPAKLQQRAELRRVETMYESILLRETQFPKASESNREIESWAEAVIKNWRVLCGPTWTDEDIGEGGKEGVGRSVLDILYRAATKTFHSTQILRHLFTVHASLAEFELAFKAYDSYVEIITRGKDRAEKTGEEDSGLDDDGMILRTSSEAIRLLCRFGSQDDAEKALNIGTTIEKWLEQIQHTKSTASDAGSTRSMETSIEPRAMAVAYSAIGISQANWARYTYDAGTRSSIQSKATQYLRKALEPRLQDANNIEALYALALVLAEMRDIPAAIKVAKRALSPLTKSRGAMSADGLISSGLDTAYGRERKLISMWHLLALLLTSRSEFSAAEKACEAAFEQFGDTTILFGKAEEDKAYRSAHLNEKNGIHPGPGIIDHMESFEKNGILQVKMTQLALVEVIEGPNVAVDDCDELLALYARLFGDPAAEKAKLPPPATVVSRPKSTIGTIRGSIFRGRGSVKSTNQDPRARSSVASSHNSTALTQTPVAAANQDAKDLPGNHLSNHHLNGLHHDKHADDASNVTRTPSKLQKRSANSLRRQSQTQVDGLYDAHAMPDETTNGHSESTQNSPTRSRTSRHRSMSASARKSTESHDVQLRPVSHNLPASQAPPPSGHPSQPPKQDTRLPAPLPGMGYIPPDPRFSKIQTRRHRVSALVDIWLFICGLYTRANMFADAREAVGEALKLVEAFEVECSQDASTAKAFASRGYGGGRSVEELWADAFAARGELLTSQSLQHEARSDFERALLHFPDHSSSIVGLSNILLDIYTQAVPLEAVVVSQKLPAVNPASEMESHSKRQQHASHAPSAENEVSPPELTRLAARDRAFGLLSTLTKLGAGWDFSEAWFALARAYEESGQLEKAKEVLWWCVELEDTHPLRSWKCVTLGGFVL